MKKFLLAVVCTLVLFLTYTHAQPTFYFAPEDTVQVNSEESSTIEIRTRDYTDLLEVRFTVRWTPGVIQVDSISDIHANLDYPADFFVIDNDAGYFTFSWQEYSTLLCNEPTATVPDSAAIFTVNFTGIEGITEIYFDDNPTEMFMTRTTACPANISCFCNSTGTIKVEGMPVSQSKLEPQTKTTLSPNPSEGPIQLTIPEGMALPKSIQVFSAQGEMKISLKQPSSTFLDASTLSPGLYFIELKWANRKEILKVVIQ
ncbi:MAG: T9SS type A sorting domain-containing protein [Bacteroidetes bacterium]|nr:T9SS type A sorting domain-containing protein [Bacteroidota bacterium]